MYGICHTEKDKLASQLEAVTVERDELVLTMKRIVRSTLTVGQAVEVLLPDCPEVLDTRARS
jgi:hypothetical protein